MYKSMISCHHIHLISLNSHKRYGKKISYGIFAQGRYLNSHKKIRYLCPRAYLSKIYDGELHSTSLLELALILFVLGESSMVIVWREVHHISIMRGTVVLLGGGGGGRIWRYHKMGSL